MIESRKLGDIEVSALGMGCWAIGGPFWEGDTPLGWGEVDDRESIRAIHEGLDNGINLIDTANIYGAGHSEYVIGKAIAGRRDKVVLSSKFGFDANEETKQVLGAFHQPGEIRAMLENSLRRLKTDYLDIFYFHIGDHPVEHVDCVANTLDVLVEEGKIRSYGWSTDDIERAESLTDRNAYTSVQFESNVFNRNHAMMAVCEKHNLAGLNRSPLAMGLLTGKYTDGSSLSSSDIRKISPEWMTYFKDGKPAPELLTKLEQLKAILTSDERTLTQGALAWLWAASPNNVPIPGFRTVEQVRGHIGALEKGALTQSQLSEIDLLLSK